MQIIHHAFLFDVESIAGTNRRFYRLAASTDRLEKCRYYMPALWAMMGKLQLVAYISLAVELTLVFRRRMQACKYSYARRTF